MFKKLVISAIVTALMSIGIAAADFDAVVVMPCMDIYEGPTTESEVMLTLERLDEFFVSAPYEEMNGFVKAKVGDAEGWVNKGEFISSVNHVVIGEQMHLYTSPACFFSTEILEANQVLPIVEEITDEYGEFYVVMTENGNGFIPKNANCYIYEIAQMYTRENRYTEFVANGDAVVYSQPNHNAATIGVIEKGEVIKVEGKEKNGYWTISWGDRYGYVNSWYVK